MPCRDDGGLGSEFGILSNKLDKVTAMLCQMCRLYSGKGDFPVDIWEWWQEHQKWDRKREREEAKERKIEKLKKKALNKLTSEEKKILGVKD